jgi:hypothetical protein
MASVDKPLRVNVAATRLTDQGQAVLDQLRGDRSVSAYLRHLIEAEAKRKGIR